MSNLIELLRADRASRQPSTTEPGNLQGEVIPEELPPIEQSLKGRAVELWRDGTRFFLVADEEDGLETIQRFGAKRGETWTAAELELVASFKDRSVRDEVETFKRSLDCLITPDTIRDRTKKFLERPQAAMTTRRGEDYENTNH